jgi:tight adherence protein B
MEYLVPFLTVMLIGTLALVLYLGRRREEHAQEQALDRRIRTFLASPAVAAPAAKAAHSRPRPQPQTNGASIPWELLRFIDRFLSQAGIKISASKYLALTLLMVAGGILLSALWVSASFALLYGLAAGALPAVYVHFERKQRLVTFSQQLPYVLDFLRSALSAGHTLIRGIQMATANAPEPIATELKQVVDQIQLGTSLADALDSMFRRVPEPSLGFLVAAIRVQMEVGSSISEIVDRVTDTIRDRQRLQQEIMTLTAQARMSGMIVAALPFLLLGFFTLIRPGYTAPLFHHPLGIKMLEAAIVLDSVAMLTIRRMVRVD